MKALITGASSGIGRDIARALAKRGYDLILVARRGDRLQLLAAELPVHCEIICADLGNLDEVYALYRNVRGKGVDVLVNNAGFGLFGAFSETSLTREIDMLNVNIRAVHVLTKLFLRDFKEKNRGHILNVASSAGFMAGPLMATYYATKSYVLRLTQAIREELRHENSRVKISALCPGPVSTEFNQVADVKFMLRSLPSGQVAEYAVQGMLDGRGVMVPGAMMKMTLFMRRLAPEPVTTAIAYHIQKRKNG